MNRILQVDQNLMDDIELSPSKRFLLETFEKQNYQTWEKQNVPQKSKLKLITKTSSRISTLDGQLVQKVQISAQQINQRNGIENQWKKIKDYQHFIQQILFENGLVDRLVDDFQLMIQSAYNKHSLKKQKANSNNKYQQIGIGTEGDESMSNSKEKQIVGILKKQKSHLSQNSQNSQKKKVTMISSQNSSETGQIQSQSSHVNVPECLQILAQQNIFKKYCFNKYKIQNIHVSFSKNFKFFTYKVEGKDSQLVEPMSQLVQVILGRSTKNFKKYLKKGQEPQDNISFSLVFTKRTYDLQADNSQLRTKFVTAISQIMNTSDYKK